MIGTQDARVDATIVETAMALAGGADVYVSHRPRAPVSTVLGSSARRSRATSPTWGTR